MRTIKTCIFDLDGVICDTAKYHFLAWKKLAGQLGIDFTEQDNEQLKGISRMESLEVLLSKSSDTYSEVKKLIFAEEKNRIYVDFISNIGQEEILPGVQAFLEYCKSVGKKTALGSVSKNAGLIITRLQLGEYFDVIIDGNQVKRAKPDPEVFLKGAMQTGTAPSQCVVFEDAQAGIEAALQAGMVAVGVGSAAALANADFIIDGFDVMEPEALLKTVVNY